MRSSWIQKKQIRFGLVFLHEPTSTSSILFPSIYHWFFSCIIIHPISLTSTNIPLRPQPRNYVKHSSFVVAKPCSIIFFYAKASHSHGTWCFQILVFWHSVIWKHKWTGQKLLPILPEGGALECGTLKFSVHRVPFDAVNFKWCSRGISIASRILRCRLVYHFETPINSKNFISMILSIILKFLSSTQRKNTMKRPRIRL